MFICNPRVTCKKQYILIEQHLLLYSKVKQQKRSLWHPCVQSIKIRNWVQLHCHSGFVLNIERETSIQWSFFNIPTATANIYESKKSPASSPYIIKKVPQIKMRLSHWNLFIRTTLRSRDSKATLFCLVKWKWPLISLLQQ